jgi:hypothetical protein
VSPECNRAPLRRFGTYTPDLHALADWLQASGVDSVAMEATGIYWIPVYEVLEARGFEVYVVNARHIKNVPGRKSDIQDCQWIQGIDSAGLLRGSATGPQRSNLLRCRGTEIASPWPLAGSRCGPDRFQLTPNASCFAGDSLQCTLRDGPAQHDSGGVRCCATWRPRGMGNSQ